MKAGLHVERLDAAGGDPAQVAARIRGSQAQLADVSELVADVISEVERRGDEAVLELTSRFDATTRPPERLRVPQEEVSAALSSCPAELRRALDASRSAVERVARAQVAREDVVVEGPESHRVTVREVPVRAAGVYAPGGGAAYPSSVVMCCVPARVAGVERVAVASPPRSDGRVDPSVLAACALCDVDEVYAMGGAQAVAALAVGTLEVSAVDVVCGPGSRWVAEAKRQLAGRVGIDSIAGPSELMAVVDAGAPVDWVVLDLLAQAEHGDDGLLVLAGPDAATLEAIVSRLTHSLGDRPSVGGPPLWAVRTSGLDGALALSVALAPEHLQIMCEGAEDLAADATTAGCVLTGPYGATAFGDYVAGSNHVLPTGGAGRFSGPLGPGTFSRSQSVVSLTAAAAAALAPHLGTLARAEGFPVHAESAEARTKGDRR